MREKHPLVASLCALTKDRTHNPCTCPDWESNPRPFALWYDAQPAEPHRLGLILPFFKLRDLIHLELTLMQCVRYESNFMFVVFSCWAALFARCRWLGLHLHVLCVCVCFWIFYSFIFCSYFALNVY